MNKQQAIKVLEFHVKTLREKGYDDIHANRAIQVLKQLPTLAEILGWEEDVEYEVNDVIYKISENVFFSRLNNSSYGFSEAYFDVDILGELRQAKKVGLKKYYLKHRFLSKNSGYNFLNYHENVDTNSIYLSSKKNYDDVKTQFTLDEIEEIKKEYSIDLKDFELIEVKDEK